MISNVEGNPKRLFPHVKTHKMSEVVQMQMEAGIERFKCATIAELEMVLSTGAKTVLIAYQMVGPKIDRLRQLVQKYPSATISSLVDNVNSAKQLGKIFDAYNLTANIYLDVDNGLHRTGYSLDDTTFGLVKDLSQIKNINLLGLHVYDGQFRSKKKADRKAGSDAAFAPVYDLVKKMEVELGIKTEVISGGSPSFSSAAMREMVFCSPGTVLLWDAGYGEMIPELDLKWAAVLMTRIISKPTKGIITVDLGHKSIGSENPMEKRINFLNLDDYDAYKHSEEHLMVKVENWENLAVGDVLYGIPFHVCPSVALHDTAHIIKTGKWVENWEILARRRKITV